MPLIVARKRDYGQMEEARAGLEPAKPIEGMFTGLTAV
jgi:hypothetical protein